MSTLIMSNGQYGNLGWYKHRKNDFKHVFCTDGAAAKARELNIIPDAIIGDMDSIHADDLLFMEQKKVKIYRYPVEKDFSDTYLALQQAENRQCRDITIWGGTGSRLDHTLANLFGVLFFVRKGMCIKIDSPESTIYMIRNHLDLYGNIGDTVSLFPMGEKVTGVTLSGFKYRLNNAVLTLERPIGLSNKLSAKKGSIAISSGILAIFHNKIIE